MYKTLSAPIRVDLEVTGQCNLQCSHCYNFWRPGNSIPAMRDNALERVLDQLSDNGIMEVTVTGGEPFLAERLVFRILEFCRRSAIAVSINSNLTLVNAEMASRLSEFRPAILTTLFSYDAGTHDIIAGNKRSYEKTVTGIRTLLNARIPVSVNMVVTPRNFTHVYETGSFAHSLGVRTFTAVRASPPVHCSDISEFVLSREALVKTLDDLVRLHEDLKLNVGNQNCYPLCMLDDWTPYEALNLRNCGAGVFHCAIGADGNVRPCVQGNIIYGNIFDEQLKAIWAKMQPWRDGDYLPLQCRRCGFLLQCTGGCRSDSCVHRGSLDALDFYAKEGQLGPVKEPLPDRPTALLSPSDKLFLPRLKHRAEEFGVLVALLHRQSRQVLVSKESAKVLLGLQEKEFTIHDVIAKYDLDELSTLTFFSYLAIRRIVRRK